MNKLTRRQLGGHLKGVAGAAALSAVAAKVLAQAPARDRDRDWNKEALESHKENSEALAKFELPMSTEPAFHFKA
jgi:hypothetical protein